MHSHNLRSMTGFGAAQRETPLGRFSVEIKSVNSRFLEISVNLSREIASLEYPLRNLIKGEIERGKVDCRVKFEPALDQEVQVRLNEPVIMQYLQILRGIREKARVPGEVTLDMILQLPGVAYPLEDNRDMEIFWKELEQVARTALAAYHQEREREGADLARHLMEEIAQLRASRAAVLPYKDQVTQRYREKLSARIAELEEQTKGKLDPGRLEMEVAMFADRADVSEELVRIEAHLNRFEDLVKNSSGKPAGKAMDFLVQEILREVNTLGSKSRDLDLASTVIEMKNCVERAREQVQNIE